MEQLQENLEKNIKLHLLRLLTMMGSSQIILIS